MPNPDQAQGPRPALLLICRTDPSEGDGTADGEGLAGQLRALGYPMALAPPDAEAARTAAAMAPPEVVMVEAMPDLASAPVSAGRSVATALRVPLVLAIHEDQAAAPFQGSSDPGHVLLTTPVTQAKMERCIELARLRHRWEKEIARSEERYRLLFERNVAGVLRESPTGTVVECNPALANMLGYERPEELRGLESDSLFADADEAGRYRALLSESGQVVGYEARMVRRDGSEIWILDNSSVVLDGTGSVREVVRTLVDVTDRKAREEDLAHMAYHDALTGLGNRRLLHIQAEQVLALADRREGRAALLFLDVVDFKDINDDFGHRVGDEVLKEVGRRLAANLRTADVSARIGGDEFAVLLAEVDDARTARVGAERLNRRLSEPMDVDGNSVNIETRIGVALFPDDGEDLESLMTLADVALTRAKVQSGPIIEMAGDFAESGQEPD